MHPLTLRRIDRASSLLPKLVHCNDSPIGDQPEAAPFNGSTLDPAGTLQYQAQHGHPILPAGTAHSTRGENTYATLEPGKRADFCVLSIDPFAQGLETLREAQQAVTQTWIGGERVWARSDVK
ncbi:hypothetical protein EHS25_001739 [Saitozyma podzolica]|jgi:imidazolonepropionase-like amidohydrolase|uniref:Amidohydrolase 3 domain-containing protein n=1 Tax=Saitozyma podzolica TaxID=1890683 RepID=A0A427YFF0_9TREE|nr:hypothetical protein EHS25_001739 [Saitozyma podzolica]